MKTKLLILFLLSLHFGVKAQTTCIGTPGQIKWEYWIDFPANAIPDSNALFALENFPNRPDGSEIIASTRSPRNFSDFFAGIMKGYIKVPVTANYTFNITGDDKGFFFLSTTNSPAQKIKRASLPDYCSEFEYNKYPEQTSVSIQLVAGQYYYFELLYFEGWGSDNINLYWKKDGVADYSIIDFNYLTQYNCNTSCPPRGTACNDGLSTTTNDKQDGFCNCVGTVATANACVGEKSLVEAYFYDNIPGSYVENDLINAPKFPLVPDRMEKLKGAFGPTRMGIKDEYGTLIQGYITVPVTGQYEFNITGDNQTFFFLSKNDSIEYKQNHQMVVVGGIAEYEHNASVLQNSGPIFLEKNKYYYYEFRHKENGWRDHFHLFWKTPFHSQRRWKKIPNFYLYDYNCEISCIAQNTPCDDGNAFTNNDKINATCDCVGTPCTGPDCLDLGAAYQSFTDCSPTNNLTTIEEAAWQSCTTAANPNAARATATHWIKYNFDDIYKFKNTRVWNYNVTGNVNKGFKDVVIDYSLDGITWTPLGGTYVWPIAPGLVDYAGFVGPNFNDQKAKFILISALNNHGSTSCSGFSKVTFDAIMCNAKDTPCDDNDPLTSYDKFDANCNCRGVDVNCASDTLGLGKITLASGTFKAKKRLESISTVPITKNISFTAGNSIVLLPGFEAKNSAVFTAEIKNCIQQQIAANIALSEAKTVQADNNKLISTDSSEIIDAKTKTIVFRLNEPGQVNLSLKDSKGNVIVTILNSYQENLGTQTKLIPTQKLKKGTYEIVLKINNNVVSEKFDVL
jgi:PA14 domain